MLLENGTTLKNIETFAYISHVRCHYKISELLYNHIRYLKLNKIRRLIDEKRC